METETETETESDEDMETEPLVFEVTEIDLGYEFDAARWYDFSREESLLESRAAELWFHNAHSYPPSPFAIQLLMRNEVIDEKTEHLCNSEDGEVTAEVRESNKEISQQLYVNETGNGTKSGVLTFIQDGNLNKVSDHSLHKGPAFSIHIHADKLKRRSNLSNRPIPRSSTLMKPTASQLAKQENARLHMQVSQIKEKGLFLSSGSEVQSAKRQKLDGGRLRKVAETAQEMDLVHKAIKKDLDIYSQHPRTKITVPQEPNFATSRRANRIRHKSDAKLDQDSTSIYRFKARPLNRKILEAPSLPIRKRSTPKLPEFQEFRLKTSERAMQHSLAASTSSYHKGSDKPDTTVLDGVNREPRRGPRDTDIPKDDDRKYHFKARPLNNKIISSGRDIGSFRKSKREPTIPLGFSFHSEKRNQPELPTKLFSKLSLASELQPNNGSRLRIPQPEQVKGSKENRLSCFQAGNEVSTLQRTSKILGKPMVQRSIAPETSRRWTNRSSRHFANRRKEKPP